MGLDEGHQPSAIEPNPGGPPFRRWGVAAGLGVVLAYFGAQGVMGSLLPAFIPREEAVLWAALLGDLVILLLLLAAARVWAGPEGTGSAVLGLVRPERLPAGLIVVILASGFFAYVLTSFGMNYVWHLFGTPSGEMPREEAVSLITSIESPPLLALAVLLAVALAPVTEELVFRRALYLPLRRSVGIPGAALLVGIVFSAAHAYLWGFPQLVVLSLVFVALYEVTGTIWAAILGHAAHNGLALTLLFLTRVPR